MASHPPALLDIPTATIDSTGASTNFALAFGGVNIGVTSAPLQFAIANGDVLGPINRSGQQAYPAVNLDIALAGLSPAAFQLGSTTLGNGYSCNNLDQLCI